jgi:hypothetical protein
MMKNKLSQSTLTEQMQAAAELLESIARNRELLSGVSAAERTRLLSAAGQISRPDALARRQLVKATKRQRKASKSQRAEHALNQTGIRKLRRQTVFTTPNVFPPANFKQTEIENDPDFHEAVEEQNCYICKQDYSTLHHFYDQLCPKCAELNFLKRTETADLRGRVALLTGGRVKIGYQAGIKLLRAGAQLIVSTRFPRDSAMRYAAEPDFKDWSDRLEIFGLDLRHTPSVEAFCKHLLTTRSRLDFIINNACQTVRRPPDFYEHMMERENGPLHDLPPEVRPLLGVYEGLRGYHILPEGAQNLRRDELRKSTSDQNGTRVTRPSDPLAGLTHAAALSQVPLLPEELAAQKSLFPKAGWTRICSRWICANAIPGGCSCTKFPSWNCWKCSSSTPSRRSSSTRGLSRSCSARRSATSTSSTSRRWRVSFTGSSRPRGIRIRTWPRPRST